MERRMMSYEEFMQEVRIEDYDNIESMTVLEEPLIKASPSPMKRQKDTRFKSSRHFQNHQSGHEGTKNLHMLPRNSDSGYHSSACALDTHGGDVKTGHAHQGPKEKARGLRDVIKTPLKRLAHSVIRCGTPKTPKATDSRRKLWPSKPSYDVQKPYDEPVIQVPLANGNFVTQPYKGKVLLSLVHEGDGLITLTILEARDLRPSRGKPVADAYCTVYVKPEETKPWISDVIGGTNNPQFQKEISVKVKLPADHGKTIVVAMWDFGSSHRDSELLGLMAFDMVALLNRREAMQGWFYLLNSDLGIGMSFLASPSSELQRAFEANEIDSFVAEMGSALEENTPEITRNPAAINIPESLHSLHPAYSHQQFILRHNANAPANTARPKPTTATTAAEQTNPSFLRFTKQLCRLHNGQGLGLALKGASPTVVTHVEPGSASHEAGLGCGDLVMEVCGRNVASWDNHQVSRLIRQCDGNIVTVTVSRHMPIIGRL